MPPKSSSNPSTSRTRQRSLYHHRRATPNGHRAGELTLSWFLTDTFGGLHISSTISSAVSASQPFPRQTCTIQRRKYFSHATRAHARIRWHHTRNHAQEKGLKLVHAHQSGVAESAPAARARLVKWIAGHRTARDHIVALMNHGCATGWTQDHTRDITGTHINGVRCNMSTHPTVPRTAPGR